MDRDEMILLADLNYVEAIREQTRISGGTIIEEDGVVLMLGPVSHPILNNAVRMDPGVEATECMRLMTDFYGAHEHAFTLILRNAVDDGDLHAAATAAGLLPLISPPEMIAEQPLQSKAPPPGVELRPVVDRDVLGDFREVAQDAWMTYGIPPEVTGAIFESDDVLEAPHLAGVVAYLDGQATSCALLHLSHGIAGIYWVSTVSAARGKGLGEACTRAVSNLGFELGARFVSLQASPMGEPVYRRMGFEQIATYQLLAKLTDDT